MSIFEDRDLKHLPLYAGLRKASRLYDKQRLELEQRAALMKPYIATKGRELDPVLRCHLGLGEPDQTAGKK